jgi:hypothetical protein
LQKTLKLGVKCAPDGFFAKHVNNGKRPLFFVKKASTIDIPAIRVYDLCRIELIVSTSTVPYHRVVYSLEL